MTRKTDLAEDLAPAWRRHFPPGSRVVVAVSGGPDSQVLLHLLARLHKTLELGALWAVGVDHGLRAAAAAELTIAARLADAHDVPFHRLQVALPARGNMLANARRARYQALHEFARQVGAGAIAVAHTATDQVETVLLHLVRGAGLRGVAGIRARRGTLVRPLLQVGREAIEAYVLEHDLACARDPGNSDPRRARARLRRDVVPALTTLNPRLEASIGRFVGLAAADEAYLCGLARRFLRQHPGPCGALPLAPLRRSDKVIGGRVLRLWLERHGARAIHASTLDALWQARAARQGRFIVDSVVVSIDRDHAWAVPARPFATDLTIPGKICLPGLNASLRCDHANASNQSIPEHFRSRRPQGVAFDADRLHFGLRLRSWHHGDRLQPFGLSGHIKVGDLFTNAKIPQPLRKSWPLVTHGDDVVWVVGLRRSNAAAVSNATRRIITIELDGALPWSAC